MLEVVIDSGYLNTMSQKEIEHQERWFEILSSEKYYCSNLELLNSLIKAKCAELQETYDLNSIFTRFINELIDLSKKYRYCFKII